MTDMPARTHRHHDSSAAAAGTAAPLPTPQYAGLFIEPDLPPLTDEAE